MDNMEKIEEYKNIAKENEFKIRKLEEDLINNLEDIQKNVQSDLNAGIIDGEDYNFLMSLDEDTIKSVDMNEFTSIFGKLTEIEGKIDTALTELENQIRDLERL